MRMMHRLLLMMTVLILCMSFMTVSVSAGANPPADDVVIYTADPTEPPPTQAPAKPTTPQAAQPPVTQPPATEPPATMAPTTPVEPIEPFTQGNAIAKDLQYHADTKKQLPDFFGITDSSGL